MNANEKQLPEYVKQEVLVEITKTSKAFWEKDRWLHKGKAPGCPFYKFGRSVRYDLQEALNWSKSRRVGGAA